MKRGYLLISIAIAALMVAMSFSVLALMAQPAGQAQRAAISAYTVHAPISITGNAGFTNASGVVWGSGTSTDPYIIAGWDVSAASTNGIYISSTTAYFIVRDCYVHDGGTSWAGIFLYSCVNGMLTGNSCSGNYYGMYISGSSGNIIANNTCSSNLRGVQIYSSGSNDIHDNNCSDNDNGIYLYQPTRNTVHNNTCSSNGNGMFILMSNSNIISGNNCSGNTIGVYFYQASNGNTLNNNTIGLNTNWGIRVTSSNSNLIRANEVRNNTLQGMYLETGSYNRIWNNSFINNLGSGSVYNPSLIQAFDTGTNNYWNCSGTPFGYGNYWRDWTAPDTASPFGIVDVPYSMAGTSGEEDNYPLTMQPASSSKTPRPPISIDGNTDFATQASMERWPGDGTSSNPYVIRGYTIDATGHVCGIDISNTSVSFIIISTDVGNASKTGIKLVNVGNCQMIYVISSHCVENGTWLSNSTNVSIKGLVCGHNGADGILISDCPDMPGTGIEVVNSTCNANNGNGMHGKNNSEEVKAFGIKSDDNGKNGAKAETCKNLTLNFKSNSNNSGDGVNVTKSENVKVEDSNVSANKGHGVAAEDVKNITIKGGNSNGNQGNGIKLKNCSESEVKEVDLSNNLKNGADAQKTNNSILSDNNCSSNSKYGICLESSSNSNTLSNNTCNLNTMDGIYLSASNSNTLSDNTCSNNGQSGIWLIASSYNTIGDNNCSKDVIGVVLDLNCRLNNLSENIFLNNIGWGVELMGGMSNNNAIWNNTFIGNAGGGIQGYDSGTNNRWNSSSGYGNFWSDWTTPDDNLPWGIVDDPYAITGGAGAMDYYPLTGGPVISYTPHAPIYINGNVQFALRAAIEGWSGDGSPENPYIIEGYEIDASSANGIQIKNTNVHFIIRNVYVSSSSHAFKGISLISAANARIENALCVDNYHGIYAASCSELELYNCNASSNAGNGMYVITTLADVSDCDAYFNGNHGMHISDCDGIGLINADVGGNGWDGVYARLCEAMTVTDLDSNGNGMYGMYLSGCTYSIVSGGGGGGGFVKDNVRSGIGLTVCTGIMIVGMAATDNGSFGIRYDTSSGINIESCILTGNALGPTYP